MDYDLFSVFYDPALERLYAPFREQAAEMLGIGPSHLVLDVPCGTGQSLTPLARPLGPEGRYVGVDRSRGMLKRARRRSGAESARWIEGDARTVSLDQLADRPFDRIHVFLGASVFADPEATLAHLWSLLAPGGRLLLVDVHAERLTLQGRLVQWMAGADLSRRPEIGLASLAKTVRREVLSTSWVHGGTLYALSADRSPTHQ
ncbi:MAG: class I SAM-dependent methyltransferase [Myxococcota bacterium]